MNQGLNTTPDDYAIVFASGMTIQLNGILPNGSANTIQYLFPSIEKSKEECCCLWAQAAFQKRKFVYEEDYCKKERFRRGYASH
jgi:hypothetical protein